MTALDIFIFLTIIYNNSTTFHIMNFVWSVNVFIGRGSSAYEEIFQRFLHGKKGLETPSYIVTGDVTTCIRT